MKLTAIILGCAALSWGATPPRLFYTDLDSGPASGNSDTTYSGTGGVYVQLYGNFFGATQGGSTVALNGSGCLTVVSWANTNIIVKLGTTCTTGNFTVTTSDGTSNGVAFTVRSGNIYYVATTGNDVNSGTFASPFRTIGHAAGVMAAGDTVYVRNGVSANTDDGSGWSTCFLLPAGGTSGNNKAMSAYPGATAQIGSPLSNANGGCDTGIRVSTQRDYWTFSNFVIRGGGVAVNTSGLSFRYINNDVSCPNGNGQAGCMDIAYSSGYKIYGNNIHNVGTNNSPGSQTALYHGFYLSEQNDHFDFGWNTIAYVYGCRGFQQYINVGNNVYAISLHDNVIHDTQCDGIIMGQTDPSLGAVTVYNNVVYNTGKGPNNAEATGAWSCVWLSGGHAGTGNVPGVGVMQFYNNTLYNCGTFVNVPYDQSSAGFMWASGADGHVTVNMKNNIIYVTATNRFGPVPYLQVIDGNGFTCTSNCVAVQGTNNLFFGQGGIPTNNQLTGSVAANPLFTNASAADFSIGASSPARGMGTSGCATTDISGQLRPGANSCDAGAYQYGSSAQVGSPTISPPAGTYTSTQSVSITLPMGATGCYRTDGNDPAATTPGTCDGGSTTYTVPFNVSVTTTVKVLATQSGLANSPIVSALYTIVPPAVSVGKISGGRLTNSGSRSH